MASRREFLRLSSLGLVSSLAAGCRYLRIDGDHFLLRSDVIQSLEQEKEILSRARVGWTDDKRVRVLFVSGTGYERGYQHGALLRDEVRDNLLTMYENALEKFHFAEFFAEIFERMRPFIPQEYLDEMHGLAHGARLPLHVVHAIHALPELTEWGGKKKLKKIVHQMMDGEVLGTTCSNFSAGGAATADGRMYVVRVLDWGLHRISKLHEYPLITVSVPTTGIASANIGWVGFLGAVSGMNAQGITLGEMGYGDTDNETLRGKPMPFLLRDVMTYAKGLPDVRKIIQESLGTNSFVFLMSDGKTGAAELYVRDRDRFEVHYPGQPLIDPNKTFPAIENVVYGGHYDDRMSESLGKNRGHLTPQMIMTEVIPYIAMKSNFHNVLYAPESLSFWVNNAANKEERAAEQPFSFFDFGKALKEYQGKLEKP